MSAAPPPGPRCLLEDLQLADQFSRREVAHFADLVQQLGETLRRRLAHVQHPARIQLVVGGLVLPSGLVE